MSRSGILTLLTLAAFVLAACGGGDADAAAETLVAEGIRRDVAECVVERAAEDGTDPDAIVDQTSDGVLAFQKFAGWCLTDDALIELLGVASLDDVRSGLATIFSAEGAMTNSEAVCLIEAVEADGFALVDIGGYTAGSPDAEGVVEALTAAQVACAGK